MPAKPDIAFVHTMLELGQAFASADVIVVEGDETLLEYAERTAEEETPPPAPSSFVRLLARHPAIQRIIERAIGPIGYAAFASTATAIVTVLAWPMVAIVAILAAWHIINKAIGGDRNVELAWKITEKASGRLVIKKVPVSQPRSRAASNKVS